MPLYRESANLLIVANVVDYYDLDDVSNDPTPVNGATVSAKVYAPDRQTQLGSTVTLTAETGQAQNTYRGIFPASVNLSGYQTVAVRYEVDPSGTGDATVIQIRWTTEIVLD